MNLTALPLIFEEIAALLEIKGENPYKVRAYQNAAKVLSQIDNLEELIIEGRLKKIEGIGEGLSRKIEEYYERGTISLYEELKREFPPSILELMKVPHLGPKRIRVIYEKLGITNLGELEYAIKENRLMTLFGFGKKTQEKILAGIEFLKKHQNEFLLVDAEPRALMLKEILKERFPLCRVEICGSIRRRKETVRDIDVLVGGESKEKVIEYLLRLPLIQGLIFEDENSAVFKTVSGINVEIRIAAPPEYAHLLLHLTGSENHIKKLKAHFKNEGLSLNPSSITNGEKLITLNTEEEIYNFIGLQFIPPELREDMGELEAAKKNGLPELVKEEDIKGLFHVHSDFSDGIDPIEKIIEFCKKMGMEYVGISDHSRSAYYARGLKVEDLKRQWEIIDEINRKEESFYVFKGIESDILPDGSLDYPPEILRNFDFVIASVHSHFNLGIKEQTERIKKALENPYVTMLGHPTGRLLLSRKGYAVDMEEILRTAKERGIVIELNSSPYRLDMDWRYLKMTKSNGILISINPDAHSKTELTDLAYGVAIARKGWLEKKDVLNTRSSSELREFFLKKRKNSL
ncbi:MAG: DNA polymerase/3'-5' exonuclease PolX [Desulfobacterota bacterium]|nr:DNA polymerase/3'-5' exonuclease PolX [Thermodesulfobacteriota bacterium]MDW8002609.1 DNA polymerase/3'-5' exonuclease PolX [Deltaproteobacteria bacterium]